MDEHLLQPTNKAHDPEQANVVFIPDATYRQLMTYPIGCDEISDDFTDNPKEPVIIDTGSKLGVFKGYLAFTHYHQCSEPIPLQYELQSGERSSISIHGVGHVGPLRRCVHAPDTYIYILSCALFTLVPRHSIFIYSI